MANITDPEGSRAKTVAGCNRLETGGDAGRPANRGKTICWRLTMARGSKAGIASRLDGAAKVAWWRGGHKEGKTDDLRTPGSEARSIALAARPSVAGALSLATQPICRRGLPIAQAASNAPRRPRTARVATDLSRCAKATLCIVALGSFPDPDRTRPRRPRNCASKTLPKSRLTGLTALIVGVDGAEAVQ
jgi:hypothetical protein